MANISGFCGILQLLNDLVTLKNVFNLQSSGVRGERSSKCDKTLENQSNVYHSLSARKVKNLFLRSVLTRPSMCDFLMNQISSLHPHENRATVALFEPFKKRASFSDPVDRRKALGC